jgi:hypothetical protein
MPQRENFVSIPPAAEQMLTQLISIAQSGLSFFHFGHPKADKLAEQISSLVKENEELKKRYKPAIEAVGTDRSLTLCLGPDKQYKLIIPTPTYQDRVALAQELGYAIASLLHRPDDTPK